MAGENKAKVKAVNKYRNDNRSVDTLSNGTENVRSTQKVDTSVAPGPSMTSEPGPSSTARNWSDSSALQSLREIFGIGGDKTSPQQEKGEQAARSSGDDALACVPHHADPGGCQLAQAFTMMRCYVAAVWAKDSLKSAHILNVIFVVLRDNVQTSADDLCAVAEELRGNRKRQVESMLFYEVPAKCEGMGSDSNATGIASCCVGIKDAAQALIDQKETDAKSIVRNHVLPLCDQMKMKIKNLKNVDEETRVVQMVRCLQCRVVILKELNETKQREETIKQGLRMLTQACPYDSMKYSIFGQLTHELAGIRYDKRLYSEAATLYSQAVTAFNAATDFASDSEKTSQIEASEKRRKSALANVRKRR